VKAFKSVNGVLFIVLGAAMTYNLVRFAGVRLESISGLILGAAMMGLGVYRVTATARARR
jgi:hypothetical protein